MRRIREVRTIAIAALCSGLFACSDNYGPGEEPITATTPGEVPTDGTSVEVTIETPQGEQTVQATVRNGNVFLADDMLLGRAQDILPNSSNALCAKLTGGWKWPGGRVPYKLHPAFEVEPIRTMIRNGMVKWEETTNVFFSPATVWDANYVLITQVESGCYSYVGVIGGEQILNLGSNCFGAPTIAHELGHTLGYWHEQQRSDRDSYVSVYPNNVEDGKYKDNFAKWNDPEGGCGLNGQNLGSYDTSSIMHYNSYEFSKNGQPTILSLYGNPLIPEPENVSSTDAAKTYEQYQSEFKFQPPYRFQNQQGGWLPSGQTFAADFDLNGRQDVAYVFNDGDMVSIDVHEGLSGGGFYNRRWETRGAGWPSTTVFMVGKFSNDNRPDIAAAFNDGGYISIDVHRNNTNLTFTQYRANTRQGGYPTAPSFVAGDFTGDGLTDIAVAFYDAGYVSVDVRPNLGNGTFGQERWATRVAGWPSEVRWLAGNFDGSGGVDLMLAFNDGGNCSYDLYNNSGAHSFVQSRWLSGAGEWRSTHKWVAADFDGNGSTDIGKAWNNYGRISIDVVRRYGALIKTTKSERWQSRQGGWFDDMQWVVGNFNNDINGRVDMLNAFDQDGWISFDLHPNNY